MIALKVKKYINYPHYLTVWSAKNDNVVHAILNTVIVLSFMQEQRDSSQTYKNNFPSYYQYFICTSSQP